MIESHVTSLAQSRKLYELGFIKKTCFYRDQYDKNEFQYASEPELGWHICKGKGIIPAYLLSEIMEALPQGYMILKTEGGYCCDDLDKYIEVFHKAVHYNQNPVTAACDLLIWCIENGFISIITK